MKIIVKNEKEKRIMRKFVNFLNKYDLIKDYMPEMAGNGYASKLSFDQFSVLSNGFRNTDIEVDPTQSEMKFDGD